MENEMRKDIDRVKNFVSLAENNDVVKDISYNLKYLAVLTQTVHMKF